MHDSYGGCNSTEIQVYVNFGSDFLEKTIIRLTIAQHPKIRNYFKLNVFGE